MVHACHVTQTVLPVLALLLLVHLVLITIHFSKEFVIVNALELFYKESALKLALLEDTFQEIIVYLAPLVAILARILLIVTLVCLALAIMELVKTAVLLQLSPSIRSVYHVIKCVLLAQ